MESLGSVRRLLDAALTEIDIAIATWETLRPADSCPAVLGRVSHTYEGNTFLTIRTALTMQMASTLSRLWDRRSDSLGFQRLRREFARPEVEHEIREMFAGWEAERFAKARSAATGEPIASDPDLHAASSRWLPERKLVAKERASRLLTEWLTLYGRYADLRLTDELTRLRKTRNKRLSHHAVEASDPLPEVETVVLRDLGRVLRASEILVERGLTLALGHDYKFLDTHRAHSIYSRAFWLAVADAPRRPPMRRRLPRV